MKILVVDDEKLLVKGIKFNLENDGYEVVTGADGIDAVELAAAGDIDLVTDFFTDYNWAAWTDSRRVRKSANFRMFQLLC